MLVLQDLQNHLQRDVDLGFLKQKDVDRINYYIDTFFKDKEKTQIIDAHDTGRNDRHNDFARCGAEYYSEVSK